MSVQGCEKYINLLELFSQRRISAQEFETKFLRWFKEEDSYYPEIIFDILDTLFAEVDDFCSDPALRTTGDIGEEQLRERCAIALNKLINLCQ